MSRGNSEFNQKIIVFCKFCHKQCNSLNSLKQHECRCPENPNRINVYLDNFNNTGRKPWNLGLTADKDERIQRAKETYQKNRAAGKHKKQGRKHTDAEKQHLRECALKNKLGGFHMRRGVDYNGIKLDSSYEVVLAKNLDLNNIRWSRPERFLYHMDGKEHYYTPDFYLPDYNVYLDPKNDFLINNVNKNLGYTDVQKITQVQLENNIKVLILDKNQLDWSVIKELLL